MFIAEFKIFSSCYPTFEKRNDVEQREKCIRLDLKQKVSGGRRRI
jgi:hypothetical protein